MPWRFKWLLSGDINKPVDCRCRACINLAPADAGAVQNRSERKFVFLQEKAHLHMPHLLQKGVGMRIIIIIIIIIIIMYFLPL